MNDNCLVCGSKMEMSRIKGLLECSSCKFVTCDINISDDELKSIYGTDYFHGKEYGNYVLDKSVMQRNFKNRLRTLQKYITDSKEKSLFEIGCAYGFFLEIAKKEFNKVFGIDISDEAIKYANDIVNVDAAADNFLNYEMTQMYDVFCMWDTIEHLRKPELFIEKISKYTNPNGLLAITTGDIGSINARIRGIKWRQIHPPTHIHYFSAQTLTKLLTDHGYEIVYTGHPGSYMSMNNITYILFMIKKTKPKLYEFFNKTGLNKLEIYINMKDLVYIIGRKKNL